MMWLHQYWSTSLDSERTLWVPEEKELTFENILTLNLQFVNIFLHIVWGQNLPPGCQWGRSPLAAWCCEHFPGRWSSRRPEGPTGTGYMCLTGTTPGGRGRPGSHPYSLSEHPGGREGGMEGGKRRMGGSKRKSQYFLNQWCWEWKNSRGMKRRRRKLLLMINYENRWDKLTDLQKKYEVKNRKKRLDIVNKRRKQKN